jgi:hypothetical protein
MPFEDEISEIFPLNTAPPLNEVPALQPAGVVVFTTWLTPPQEYETQQPLLH